MKYFKAFMFRFPQKIYGKLIREKSVCWQGLLSLLKKSDSENFKTVRRRLQTPNTNSLQKQACQIKNLAPIVQVFLNGSKHRWPPFHFISIHFICNPVGCHRKWHSVRNSKAVGSTCISLKTARGSHFAKTRRKKTSDWKTPLFLRKKDKQDFTILDISHMFIHTWYFQN